MKLKIFAISCLVWTVIVLVSANRAQATILVSGMKATEVVTEVVVTNRFRTVEPQVCNGDYGSQEQFVVLFISDQDGTERVDPQWVTVTYKYTPGHKIVGPQQIVSCEEGEFQYYGIDTCFC